MSAVVASRIKVMRLMVTPNAIVNVSSVPQRSPFRYPGGKTWLIPLIRRWLQSLQPRQRHLLEPFAGGGIVGLTAAFEGLVDTVTLVELDDDVTAVWRTILSPNAPQLAEAVLSFDFSPQAVEQVLSTPPETLQDQAFRTLLVNRVHYGGIIAPGASPVKFGENGKGIASRWYPRTLYRRILAIAAIRDRMRFIHGDGLDLMQAYADDTATVCFIDPPYTVAGRRLYKHSDIDHDGLFRLADRMVGDFLITYDNTLEIRGLAERHGMYTELVPMKTTKHECMMELLIGRKLDWARAGSALQFGENPLLKDLETDGHTRS
mgnify:CR=1 FL=1